MSTTLPHEQQRALIVAQEKRASALVTMLPLQKHGISLSKVEFRDQLLMRYRSACVAAPSMWTILKFVIWEALSTCATMRFETFWCPR